MKLLLTLSAILFVTSFASECKDKLTLCAKYKKEIDVCTRNVVRAKEYCAKTCNMCDDKTNLPIVEPSTALPVVEENVCVDQAGEDKCKMFASNPKKCQTMEFLALRNCRKTCGKCSDAEVLVPAVESSTSLPIVEEECKDKWTFCKKYMCTSNSLSAKYYCRKTCDMCGDKIIQPELPDLQPVLSCGNPTFKIDEDIHVAKKEAKQHSFPWQVEICSTEKSGDGKCLHFCGGSVIDKEWVLTARHCVDFDYKYPSIKLKFGVHNTEDDNGPNVVMRGIDRVLKDLGVEDIALIKLDSPITYNDNIQPICIPKRDIPAQLTAAGKLGFVSGWGATTEGGPFSDVLQQVQVPFRNVSDCKMAYKNRMSDHALCAGGKGSDTCQGDSGSPLVVKNKNGHWFQAGVVAFGDGCGNDKQPGVYEKSRCGWISLKIRKNICVEF